MPLKPEPGVLLLMVCVIVIPNGDVSGTVSLIAVSVKLRPPLQFVLSNMRDAGKMVN